MMCEGTMCTDGEAFGISVGIEPVDTILLHFKLPISPINTQITLVYDLFTTFLNVVYNLKGRRGVPMVGVVMNPRSFFPLSPDMRIINWDSG